MRLLKIKNTRFIPIFLGVFAVVFHLESLVVNTTISNEKYAILSVSIYTIVLILRIIIKTESKIPYKEILFALIACILIATTSIINMDFNVIHLMILLELYKAVVTILWLDFQSFLFVFKKSVTLLAGISVLIYFISMIYPEILNFAQNTMTRNGSKVYSFFVYYSYHLAPFRNTGFAHEPGVFQHYTNIALIISLFCKYNNNCKKDYSSIILTLASLTTFSSAGIIFLVLIWIAYLLSKIKSLKYFYKSSFIIIICTIVFYNIPFFKDGMLYSYRKLIGISTTSLRIRLYSIVSGIIVFFENPLLGKGFKYATEKMETLYLMNGYKYNQTSTISSMLAMFGLPFTLIMTIPFLRFFTFVKRNTITLGFFCILCGIILSINNERFIFNYTYYLFVVYGLTKNKHNCNGKTICNK